MKAVLLEVMVCAVGLTLTVGSILVASFAAALLGQVFTAVGFGMLIMRSGRLG